MNKDKNSFLDWLGILDRPNWQKARPLGRFIGVFLTLAIPLLFITALLAAFAVISHTIILGFTGSSEGVNLGAGALIAALLGSPFLIWSTYLKNQSVLYQKEAHITDRINKAVEQLGAEKTVERIGRPVTIWTGKVDRTWHPVKRAQEFSEQPRTKLLETEYYKSWNEKEDDIEEGYMQSVSRWPDEKTFIEWQGESISIDQNDAIGTEGPWQVFKETLPNIEVRIGAILSLERIAQDSVRFDRGHDHVRVMEILCAYVRENTPTPNLDPEHDEEGPFTLRTDVQIAIDVIKRRSPEQIEIEATQKYRLDLSRCDFRGANLSDGAFQHANFSQCRFEFSFPYKSDFSGSNFFQSVLNHVQFIHAKLVGADMTECRIDKPETEFRSYWSPLAMADIRGLCLISAYMPAVQIIGNDPVTFGTKDTILHPALMEEVDKEFKKRPPHQILMSADLNSPFAYWSPFNGADGTTGDALKKFRRSLSLTSWPYEA